jgi:hypothetical protein
VCRRSRNLLCLARSDLPNDCFADLDYSSFLASRRGCTLFQSSGPPTAIRPALGQGRYARLDSSHLCHQHYYLRLQGHRRSNERTRSERALIRWAMCPASPGYTTLFSVEGALVLSGQSANQCHKRSVVSQKVSKFLKENAWTPPQLGNWSLADSFRKRRDSGRRNGRRSDLPTSQNFGPRSGRPLVASGCI